MRDDLRRQLNTFLVLGISLGLLTPWSQAQDSIVFVTSEQTDGSIDEPGFPAGIESADAICNRLAIAATLNTTNGSYLAWLSTGSTSPDLRFFSTLQAGMALAHKAG